MFFGNRVSGWRYRHLYYYDHLSRMNEAQQYTLWFPDYLFIRYIGKGSYGDVYYCIRKIDNTKVVLKIVGII